MAYRLKPGQPIGSEVRRLVAKQIELALGAIHGPGTRAHDKATHRARRHIKKVRALIRLVQPSLVKLPGSANRRLKTVSRLLAPIADAEAVVDTLDQLRKKYPREISPQTFRTIRAGLLQLEARTGRKAKNACVSETVARLLRAELTRSRRWRLRKDGFRGVAPGLEQSVRRSRRAMKVALECPTNAHYHAWRQRVKDLWLQVRILQARCGGALAAFERQLEKLDGCLGEYHNCALLQDVLVEEAFLSRPHTARCLRLIRRYQRELRSEAVTLGAEVHREKPRRFIQRLRRLWRLATPIALAPPAGTRQPWQRVA